MKNRSIFTDEIGLSTAYLFLCLLWFATPHTVSGGYLWIIIALSEIITIAARYSRAKIDPLADLSASKAVNIWRIVVVAIAMPPIGLSFIAENVVSSSIAILALYLVTGTCTYCALKTAILALDWQDHRWLDDLPRHGLRRNIGAPNTVSILRIAAALLIPHIYFVQSFDANSSLVATILLICAILTDALDGMLARKLSQSTKLGKALDPFGDKLIFYPTAIAFAILTGLGANIAMPANWIFVYRVALACVFGRDLLFLAWFCLFYAKLPAGIGASFVDKIRMLLLSAWLGLTATYITVPAWANGLSRLSLIVMLMAAIFSLASITVDYQRVYALNHSQRD